MVVEDPVAKARWIEHLQKFSLFEPGDDVYCVREQEILRAGYNARLGLRDVKPCICVQLQDSTCYVLEIDIPKDIRRKGHGRALVASVEAFAKEQGCKQVMATPSGMGKLFWPVLGYAPDQDEVVKTL